MIACAIRKLCVFIFIFREGHYSGRSKIFFIKAWNIKQMNCMYEFLSSVSEVLLLTAYVYIFMKTTLPVFNKLSDKSVYFCCNCGVVKTVGLHRLVYMKYDFIACVNVLNKSTVLIFNHITHNEHSAYACVHAK